MSTAFRIKTSETVHQTSENSSDILKIGLLEQKMIWVRSLMYVDL